MLLKMTDSSTIFHCIQEIENDFERAYVDLDLILTDPSYDYVEDWTVLAIKKMRVLSSCFSKLSHKCQSTANSNAKLVTESATMRKELLQAKSKYKSVDIETSSLIRQLHALQSQLFLATNNDVGVDVEHVNQRLQRELEIFQKEARSQCYLKEEVALLSKEKETLKNRVSQLEKELYGARLAANYLDKELAGRLQQIQLLGQKEHNGVVGQEKVWKQLQSEILFNRQKTVIKACKGPPKLHSKTKKSNTAQKRFQPRLRKITIHKTEVEGYGISVTDHIIATVLLNETNTKLYLKGGLEHRVPILVSSIHKGGVVDREGGLDVGDAILAINGVDLSAASHDDAIKVLTKKTNRATMLIGISGRVIDEEDSDDEDRILNVEMAGDSVLEALKESNTSQVHDKSGKNKPAANRAAATLDSGEGPDTFASSPTVASFSSNKLNHLI